MVEFFHSKLDKIQQMDQRHGFLNPCAVSLQPLVVTIFYLAHWCFHVLTALRMENSSLHKIGLIEMITNVLVKPPTRPEGTQPSDPEAFVYLKIHGGNSCPMSVKNQRWSKPNGKKILPSYDVQSTFLGYANKVVKASPSCSEAT